MIKSFQKVQLHNSNLFDIKVVLKPQKSHSLAKFLYSSVKCKSEVSAQNIWVKFYSQFMQEVK